MVSEEHEVVISGIGGCFPDARGLREFGEQLFASSKLIRPDPARWSAAADKRPPFTGRIPESDRFDCAFFGIPHKLIKHCDPLMGQMLERTFEAIIDAGVNPIFLKGRNVSVMTATAISDAESLRYTEGVKLDGFGMVGISRSMMANRISYYFNFNGPSHSLDCSWESAAQALEIAASQIARGEVEAAVVASCNLVAFDAVDYEYNQLNWLSEDGESRPFDAQAQGFARSEGTVCLFLQRSSLAKRRYCSLVKSQSIFLGDRLSGYLHLDDRLGQFLAKFYAETSVKPEQVAYVEAAGWSILDKDAEELNAIAAAFKSSPGCPLLIGSVSGNLGHSEAPSAFVSLVKAVIAMETGVIPPTVNYNKGNPDVAALRNGEIKVVTEATPLTSELIAVNGVSFSGSAAHILVERNSRVKQGVDPAPDGLPRLVILQARHEQGAKDIIDKICSMPPDEEYISMVNDVFKTPVPAYLWRGHAIVPTAVGKEKVKKVQVCDSASRPVWWVFSGMGSQWPEMGRDLMRLPAFAAAVERCDRALRPKGVDITRILTTEDPSVLDNILNCFVGIATIQVGLVDVLRTVGVSPAGMVGHSVGELGCAYADGCFTAEQTVLAAYARGRASVETEVVPGMMAAVGLGYHQIKNQVPDTIDVACHNALDSCSLSGPADDVIRYVDGLKKQGIFAKAVNTAGIAYHSRYIKDIAPKLVEYLKEVVPEPKQRSARWVSSSVPESLWASEEAALCSAEYHTNNLLSPVLFEEACKYIPTGALVIEIAPRGLLQAILRRSLSEAVNISLASRQAESNLHHLLGCIGQLHLHNVPVDVNALYPPARYPVSRGTPSLTELVTWDHDDIHYQDFSSHVQMLISQGDVQKYLDISKKAHDFVLWKDHRIHGQVVVPFHQFLIYTWKMMFLKLQVEFEDSSIIIEDMTIRKNFTTNELANTLLSFSPNTGSFEIVSQVKSSFDTYLAMTGKLSKCINSSIDLEEISKELSPMEEIEGQELYQNLAHLGLQLGSQYQLIQTLFVGSLGCYAKIAWTGSLLYFLESLFDIVIFLKSDSEEELFLPSTFIKLTLNTAFFNTISTGTIVDVHYNRATNVLVCSGVKICGLTLTRAPPPPPLNHSLTDMKFQPYFETKLTVQELMSASVRLASETGLECWADKATTKMTVLVVNSGSKQPPSFIEMIKHLLKQEQGAHCTVQEVEASQMSAAVSGCSGLLVVADSALLPFVVESVPQYCQLYCLTKPTKNGRTSLFKLYQPILASLGSAENVALVKRVPRGLDIKIFEASTSKWLGNLRKLVNSSNEETCFVVVSRKYDPQVLPTLALEPYAIRLRIFFLLGSAPISLKSQLFTGQLDLGLPVNVLSNGVWAFLRPTNISTNTHSISLDCYFKSSIPDWKQLECVSLNTTSFPTEENFHDKVEYVDYSGTNEGGKVMGVGRLDPDGQQMTPDPILRWPVPSGWSMEDAATVPVAYSLAYYCVYLKGRLEPGDSLLVTDALSPVGQAAVAVALHAGALVFASVHDNEQAKQLIDLFPMLKTKQVLVLGPGSSLNAFVRQEVNKGADVVINCLRGKHLQDSANAMAGRGTFLHLGQIKVEDREKIGMMTFLRNTTFCGVSLHNIHNCHYSEKSKMQDLVRKGIQQGIVKPLKKTVVSNAMQKKGLRNLFTSKPTEKIVIATNNYDKKHQTTASLKVDTEKICIIAGLDMECILLVAQWLTSFGARKFAVLVEKADETNQYCHQFNRLVNQHGKTVLMTSLSRLDSPEEADSLLKEVYRMGTVSYIFCVSLAEQRVNIIEESSGRFGRVQFVSLLCKGASKGTIVYSRASETSVRSVLPYLSSLLTGVTQHSGQPKCFIIEDIKSATYKHDAGKCQLPLPRNLDQLIAVGDSCCGAAGFSEVVTLSPGLRHFHQDLLPVFLIPATSPASLQPLTSRLMHPAFCCNPPMSVQSIEQVAEDLMKDLFRLRGKGPFTLVGDSWNSLVALHLGALLEAQGHQVEMFLLEGLPSTVSVAIRALGETTHGIESKLVSTCLNLPDKVKYTQAQMKTVPVEARPAVLRALDSLLGQLTALTHVQAPRHLFQGHVTLITASQPASTELEDLEMYCKQTPSIILTGTEDHQQLIASYKTASAINENAAFSWDM